MSYISFPENFMIIPGQAPVVGAAAAINALPISLKNVQKLWAVCYVNTVGTSGAVAIVPQTDALVAFGSAASLVNVVQIWANQNTAASNTWAKQTDAVNFTTTADANHKIVVFEIDPASLVTTTTATSEDCFRIRFTAVAAGDYVAVYYIVQPRYPAAVGSQPSYILD